jgi:tripartite-type tricarboxylate transporter receptor subunit TctC
MRAVCTWAALALSLFMPGFACAEYPVKPIHLVIPYPPGGPTDVLGRALGQKLGEALGQSISLLATYGNVLVVSPNLPVNNVKQLLDLARAKPGEITFGSAGNGASNHLSGELLASMGGVRMQHVPYKGSAPALLDVMAGQTSFMFDILSTSLPQIKAGKVRAIA